MAETEPTHPQMDLSTLSIGDLKELADQAQRQIKALEDQQRRDAFKRLDEFARELGLSKADLAAHYAARKYANSSPRYRNLDNPAETWTGRGRKPAWVVRHLNGGGKLDDLAIS